MADAPGSAQSCLKFCGGRELWNPTDCSTRWHWVVLCYRTEYLESEGTLYCLSGQVLKSPLGHTTHLPGTVLMEHTQVKDRTQPLFWWWVSSGGCLSVAIFILGAFGWKESFVIQAIAWKLVFWFSFELFHGLPEIAWESHFISLCCIVSFWNGQGRNNISFLPPLLHLVLWDCSFLQLFLIVWMSIFEFDLYWTERLNCTSYSNTDNKY